MFFGKMTSFLTLCVTSLLAVHATDHSSPILDTPSGPIKGVVVPALGHDVIQFRNIPYAKPPIGELRFRKPVPIEPWTETLDGTAFGPSCIQYKELLEGVWEGLENQELSEDCLQLNVYVPRAISTSEKKAVMVMIHGGSFLIGQAAADDPSFLALKDVIVVSINYRLGIFGFLSTGDDVIRGNFAIWDMIESLKWVNRNIAAFGGDPERVTVFGESAGGFAASTLAVIPMNKGLFHRIIAQSGSVTSLMAFSRDPLRVAKAVAQELECIPDPNATIDNKVLTDCFQTKTTEELLEVQMNKTMNVEYFGYFSLQSVLWPVVDAELFFEKPVVSLKDPNSEVSIFYRSLDVIAGTTSNEGSLTVYMFHEHQEKMNFDIKQGLPTPVLCEVLGPAVARDMYGDESLSDAICKEYSSEDQLQQSKNINYLYEDSCFVAPALQLVEFHAQERTSSNTYHYVYSQELNFTFMFPLPAWMDGMGAGHAMELPYLFGPASQNDKSLATEEGRAFTDVLVLYWTNFAKTGNPNGGSLVPWKPFSTTSRDYMELKFKPAQGQNLYERRMNFLLHDIPSMHRRDA
ncbi:fatty acyl-CoA hydrolase precursor, medium chain-like [Pecten maximus]|uniref:fatty acyl-CoA hydrolase precursor, medium chain-like n=1 Tax=Pecten maximus TaxID=6579 RepID=UPI00145831B7|nr:fatty acyl-CoA hydrolase precursor, medium chain-like [Pecten maximus]